MSTQNANNVETAIVSNVSAFINAKQLKSGAVSNRPLSRVAFRKLHGLTNADAKRLYAAALATWQSKQAMGLTAALESGYGVTKVTAKSGKNGDSLNVTLFKASHERKETLREKIARLEAELAASKQPVGKMPMTVNV